MARAPVSKTGGWGFESLHSCQYNQALNAAAVRTKGVLDPILDPSLAENALR
jgi:hypothetical protein